MKAEQPKLRWAAYWGAAAGLIVFTLVGLLPSSFIGGILGLKAAGLLFGIETGTTFISRIFVGISMIVGVAVTGCIFVVSSASFAWAAAQIAELLRRHIAQQHL